MLLEVLRRLSLKGKSKSSEVIGWLCAIGLDATWVLPMVEESGRVIAIGDTGSGS